MGSKQLGNSLAEGLGDKAVCLRSAKGTQWHPETIQDTEAGNTSENCETKVLPIFSQSTECQKYSCNVYVQAHLTCFLGAGSNSQQEFSLVIVPGVDILVATVNSWSLLGRLCFIMGNSGPLLGGDVSSC